MDLVFFISCQSNISEAMEKPLAQELELQEDSSGRGNQTFPQLKNLPLPMAPPSALDPIPAHSSLIHSRTMEMELKT